MKKQNRYQEAPINNCVTCPRMKQNSNNIKTYTIKKFEKIKQLKAVLIMKSPTHHMCVATIKTKGQGEGQSHGSISLMT